MRTALKAFIFSIVIFLTACATSEPSNRNAIEATIEKGDLALVREKTKLFFERRSFQSVKRYRDNELSFMKDIERQGKDDPKRFLEGRVGRLDLNLYEKDNAIRVSFRYFLSPGGADEGEYTGQYKKELSALARDLESEFRR